MATERITNGTFASDISGWTATEAASVIPGVGPAANGDIAWTSGQSGSARVQSNSTINLAYNGALYQDIGTVTAGTTMRLTFDLYRRFQGTVDSAHTKLTALFWCSRGSEDPQPMLAVRNRAWSLPRRWPLYPVVIFHDVTTGNVFEQTTGTYDVSQFFNVTGEYRIWLSGDFFTGDAGAPGRCQVFFTSVSLLDFGTPGPDVADLPTGGRTVRVVDSIETSVRVRT